MAESAIFEAEVVGARGKADEFREGAKELRGIINREFKGPLQAELHTVFADAAPYDELELNDTTHLRDELEVRVSYGSGRITATVHSPVRDPRSGFAYTEVTRFGRGPVVARAGGRLSWMTPEGRIYRKSVAAWSPGSDWVRDAEAEADQVIDESANRIGRAITTRVL